jgi:hypothetical protein
MVAVSSTLSAREAKKDIKFFVILKCQIFHFRITAPSRRYTSDFYPPLLSCVYVYVMFGLDWQVLVAEDAVSRALGPPGQTPNPRTKSKQITKEASKTSDSGTRLLAFSFHFTSKRIAYQMKIP